MKFETVRSRLLRCCIEKLMIPLNALLDVFRAGSPDGTSRSAAPAQHLPEGPGPAGHPREPPQRGKRPSSGKVPRSITIDRAHHNGTRDRVGLEQLCAHVTCNLRCYRRAHARREQRDKDARRGPKTSESEMLPTAVAI